MARTDGGLDVLDRVVVVLPEPVAEGEDEECGEEDAAEDERDEDFGGVEDGKGGCAGWGCAWEEVGRGVGHFGVRGEGGNLK